MKNAYAEAITELEKSEFSSASVLFEIARKNPGAYVAAIRRLRDRSAYADWKQHCIGLMRSELKIEAIKYCRNATGMTLKDAKDAVEALPLA